LLREDWQVLADLLVIQLTRLRKNAYVWVFGGLDVVRIALTQLETDPPKPVHGHKGWPDARHRAPRNGC
jgi:hypothetical protein